MIDDMDNKETDKSEEKTQTEKVRESLLWVVDMMNSGKVNPDDVYPKGRYQGD